MIGAVMSRFYGNISDGVLMANVPRDALADGHHLADLVGKKGFAARRLCQALEHPRVPVLIAFVEYTHGIDDGAGLPGQFHDLVQAARTGIVAAITDDEKYFLIPAASLQFLQPFS